MNGYDAAQQEMQRIVHDLRVELFRAVERARERNHGTWNDTALDSMRDTVCDGVAYRIDTALRDASKAWREILGQDADWHKEKK